MGEEDRELLERVYRKIIMSRVGESVITEHNRGMCPNGVLTLNRSSFTSLIRECTAAVIDFYADWCIPCKIMEPILRKLAQIFAGKVLFGRINVDEHPEIAVEYGVMSIPTTLLMKDGEEVYRVIGAVDFNTMRRFIEIYLGVKP